MSPKETRPLSLRLPAVAKNVGVVRQLVGQQLELLGMDEERIAEAKVAVSEAVSNVAKHAYRDRDEPGDFRLDVVQEGESVSVTVADEGVGPAPNPASDGIRIGLSMMASFADSLEVTGGPERGTTVKLRFHLHKGAESSTPP